jgi:alpha-glucoside transport system permease protein
MTQAQAPVIVVPIVAKRRGPRGLGRWPIHLAVIGLVVLWLLPTIGLLVNSIRTSGAVASSGWWTAIFPPYDFTIDNYIKVLTQQSLGQAFINSFLITVPVMIIVIAFAAFSAYAFAWMDFPFKNVLFVTMVGLLVVPLQTTLIPVTQLFRAININGTPLGPFLGVWVAHVGYGLPFAIYLLRNFMGSLPREVFESASIDGASSATAFFRLALPMSVPAIAALAIFQFLWVWNDLLVALVFIGPVPANQPLTQVVSALVSSRGLGWEYLTAAAFITMIVPLGVFFALQRYFVRGITGGAVKG